MRSPALLRTVLRTLDEIRAVNPDAVYGAPYTRTPDRLP
jgi:hypothetical protein